MVSVRHVDYGQFVQYATAFTLVVTVLTAVPSFVSYLNGVDGIEVLTHLHVWFGVACVLVAATNFFVVKRPLFRFRRYC